jgi:hypothetical protein
MPEEVIAIYPWGMSRFVLGTQRSAHESRPLVHAATDASWGELSDLRCPIGFYIALTVSGIIVLCDITVVIPAVGY